MPMTTGYKIKGITGSGRFSLYFSNISELSTYNMRKKNRDFSVVKSKFRLTVLRVYSFSPSFQDVQYTHFDRSARVGANAKYMSCDRQHMRNNTV